MYIPSRSRVVLKINSYSLNHKNYWFDCTECMGSQLAHSYCYPSCLKRVAYKLIHIMKITNSKKVINVS